MKTSIYSDWKQCVADVAYILTVLCVNSNPFLFYLVCFCSWLASLFNYSICLFLFLIVAAVYDYDFALVKIRSSSGIQFNQYIEPACLPDPSIDTNGKSCLISGWGWTGKYGKWKNSYKTLAHNSNNSWLTGSRTDSPLKQLVLKMWHCVLFFFRWLNLLTGGQSLHCSWDRL